MDLFWKIKCPSCRKSTGIGGALLQIEMAPRSFSCGQCGRKLTTNFETRTHITAYRLLVSGILAGFLLGLALSGQGIIFRLYTLDILGLLTNEIPQLLIASSLGLTAIGIPGLIYFAPIIQGRIDSVCEGKHSQIVAISPIKSKKPKLKEKVKISDLDDLDNSADDFIQSNTSFSSDTVAKPKKSSGQTNQMVTPSGVASSVNQQQRLGVKSLSVKSEVKMTSDKTSENSSFYQSSAPPKDDRVREMSETLDDLRIEVNF